jgi:hypothetical protein
VLLIIAKTKEDRKTVPNDDRSFIALSAIIQTTPWDSLLVTSLEICFSSQSGWVLFRWAVSIFLADVHRLNPV